MLNKQQEHQGSQQQQEEEDLEMMQVHSRLDWRCSLRFKSTLRPAAAGVRSYLRWVQPGGDIGHSASDTYSQSVMLLHHKARSFATHMAMRIVMYGTGLSFRSFLGCKGKMITSPQGELG